MPTTLQVNEVDFNGYNLSVTTRDGGDDPKILEELTLRTMGAWLKVVSQLELGAYVAPFTGSVEDRYCAEIDSKHDTDAPNQEVFKLVEKWGDPRVTVWNTYRSEKKLMINGIPSLIRFHLNSDDDTQVAIDTWVAQNNAIARLKTQLAKTAPQSNVAPSNSSATLPQGNMSPATPKSQNPPQNGNLPIYTKKEAIAKLNAGDSFRMRVTQLKKRSQDGKDYYEIFEPMGSKPGEYSSVTVYTDNEPALNNGLIAALDSLGIKLGQALTGNWLFSCTVGKPKTKTVKGEEKTYTNVYANSFEVQG